MKVLWLAWKDPKHPAAGGAEVVLWELSQRLIRDGHEVAILTCGYDGAADRETVDGVDIIRVGRSRYLHPFQALAYYFRNLRNKYDVVVETVNTAPYFAVFFGRKSRRYLFYHQLAREIWFYETIPPVSQIGYYILEPLATRILSVANVSAITVSESSRRDLLRFGFQPDQVHIISEGIELEPVADLSTVKKFDKPTLLSLGALRAMKRTMDQVEAFEKAKVDIPDLQLKIAGSANDRYGKAVLERAAVSPHAADIDYLGRVSEAEKIMLMQRCHLILVTSLKEGWGLIVTEANSQGTPAVVYDVDGLRDSVRHDKTGLVALATPSAIAEHVTSLLNDSGRYDAMRRAAWNWSKEINFDKSYKEIGKVITQ